MRIIALFLFISILLGVSVPFKVGESLQYQASFSGIETATGKLEVIKKEMIQSTSTFQVRFSATTKGFTDYLFPIRDVIDIWLDEKTLLPLKVVKNISEGSYKKKNTIILNQKEGFALFSKDTIQISSETHSPYSLFYFLRSEDLSNIDGQIFSLIDGRKLNYLQMNVEENVATNVPLGIYQCTKVTPIRMDKQKFKNEATMSIWFSNDDVRYPVKISIKMKFGTLILKLNELIK
tara:strand:+ start:16946 stop:17650 length:705 start_codon:yes stop_codon:yes gene_type:complete